MAKPNGGLVQETNAQYYAGSQTFLADGTNNTFTTTFNTDLVFGNYDPNNKDYANNNFKLYTSTTGIADSYTEYVQPYTVDNNTITITATPANNLVIVVQLKTLTGGNYGDQNAYGNVVEENYGSYAYIKVSELVTNLLVG